MYIPIQFQKLGTLSTDGISVRIGCNPKVISPYPSDLNVILSIHSKQVLTKQHRLFETVSLLCTRPSFDG